MFTLVAGIVGRWRAAAIGIVVWIAAASLSVKVPLVRKRKFQGLYSNLFVIPKKDGKESKLPINVREIRAIRLALQHFHHLLAGCPIRIQSDNATAVAYINHQGGTRSRTAMFESQFITSAIKASASHREAADPVRSDLPATLLLPKSTAPPKISEKGTELLSLLAGMEVHRTVIDRTAS
ncbi:unnamed protein product [Ranitomeya imitator]|uniref:Reverse transcriptase RNase H-like domain-containing protein n=1 Tax=Ranitomeya imitator TaxID=111125 RepID=A0ABN9L4T6_9NEOB|nr:unnamed protein product [Ranitomeya imitator]